MAGEAVNTDVTGRQGKVVSVGLISGNAIDTPRALWQSKPDDTGRYLSIVPREGQIDVADLHVLVSGE